MNYLTRVFSTQQDIGLVSKNHCVITYISNYLSSVEKNKTILFRCLMMSCLVLSCIFFSFMPKSSMVSASNSFSPSLFCEYNCSRFVSVPAEIGKSVGALSGFPVGFALGIPVSVGLAGAMVISGDEPKQILQEASFGVWFSSIIVAVAGAKVVSDAMAFPFWVAETLVYDVPYKVIRLVQGKY